MKREETMEPDAPAGERLDSWKEIAAYLKRDARTVRRWEKSEGLPVHRHVHRTRPTVYAYRHEIDDWWNNRKPRLEAEAPTVATASTWPHWLGALVLIGLLLSLSFFFLPARTGEISRSTEAPESAVVQKVFANLNLTEGCRTRNISPDGRFMGCLDRTVSVIDLARMERRVVAEPEAGFPTYGPLFHPDSKSVAYTLENFSTRVFDVQIAHLDGETRTIYRVDGVEPEPVAWSRDGTSIALTLLHSNGDKEIAIVSANDGSLRFVKRFAGTFPTHVSFSPNGDHIAWAHASDSGGTKDIFLFAVDGGAETRLTSHPADDSFPVWLPNGSGLFFLSNRTGSVDAWFLPMNDSEPGGPPRVLHRELGNVIPLGLTDDGEFFYRLQVGLVDVYTAAVDLDSGELLEAPQSLPTKISGTNMMLAWSPDGRHAAFVSARGWSPRWVLVVQDLETGVENVFSQMRYVRRPEWAPDGRTLLVRGTDQEGREGTFEVDAATGDVLLQVVPHMMRLALWANDGDGVVYQEPTHRLGSSRLVRRDLSTGEDQEIFVTEPPAAMRRFRVSKDGLQIAFVYQNPTTSSVSLMVMPAAGGERRELVRVPDSDWISIGDWSPDGRYVLFQIKRAGNEEAQLYRVAVDDGNMRALAVEAEGLRDISVHPDGRHIGYTVGWPLIDHFIMKNAVPAGIGAERVADTH